MECAKKLYDYESIEEYVEKAMDLKNLKFEVKDENGNWVEVKYKDIKEN